MASAKPIDAKISEIRAIRDDEVYALPDFQRVTGLGAKSVRRAVREGLPIHRQGRRSYIVGRDWREHLQKSAAV